MKKSLLKLSFVLLLTFTTSLIFGQAPQKMSFQAVIRNASNTLVANTAVGMRISVLQGSSSGTAVYVETQTALTNINGLVSIQIGSGTLVSGNFSTINWSSGNYWVKSETDPTGGSNYTIIGTTQLLSVPYALYAASGNQGPQGAAGPQGAQGPAGPTGATGPQGAQGPAGPTGATGSQGAQGPAGPTGPQGSTGPIGATGAAGSSGFNTVLGFSGLVNSINGLNSSYVFAGPTAVITITSTSQSIIAVASAPLGLANGGPQAADIGMCYRLGTTGTITNFVSVSFSSHSVTSDKRNYTGSATVTGLPPGTYYIGLGVRNDGGAIAISNNDYVNGWVMVTN